MARSEKSLNTDTRPNLPGAFELFKPSWEAVKINASPIILFTAITVILSVAGAIVGRYVSPVPVVTETTTVGQALQDQFTPYYIGSNILVTLVSVLLAPGLTIALLKAAKGESIGIAEAFTKGLKIFWRYLGLTIVMGALTVLGFLLFIVPGFFVIKSLLLAPYYLIDRNMTIKEALKSSARDTKRFGNVWGIIGVIILFAFITGIPIIGWIIGIAGSVAYLAAPAIRYLQYKEISE